MELTCSVCNANFPLSEKRQKSAKCPSCFKLMKQQCAKAYKQKISDLTEIQCNQCNCTKLSSEYKGNGKVCKSCANGNEKARYNKNKKAIKDKKIDKSQKKTCSVCNETKCIDNFFEAKCKGTIRAACKECTSKLRKENYQNNRENVIKKNTEYMNNRKKSDPAYKLERNLRCRLYHAFKNADAFKRQRTMIYVDCTPKFFKAWMQFQFDSQMTFENHGTYWDIDHVKPCASFDLSDDNEARKCFHWSNCRPLNSQKNREKSDKYNAWDTVVQDVKANFFKNIYEGQKSSPPHT